MTDIYVNTDVAGPGTGTIGDPYKSLQTAFSNRASSGSQPYTFYCSGVATDDATINSFPNSWYQNITVVGDSTGAGYEADKYKCNFQYLSEQQLDIGVSHVFKNIQMTNTAKRAIDIQRGGIYRFYDCKIFIAGASNPDRVISIVSYFDASNIIINNTLLTDVLMSGNYLSNQPPITILAPVDTGSYEYIGFHNLTVHITKNTGNAGILSTSQSVVVKNGILLRNSSVNAFSGGAATTIADTLVSGIGGTPTSTNNDIIPGAAYDPYILWENWDSGDYTLRGDATDAIDKCPDVSSENGGITTDITGAERVLPWDRGVYEASRGGPYPGEHIVTNLDNVSDPNCIYYQQGVKIGDTFSFKETTEINGWGVSIDVDGYPIIDSQGGVGADSFLFDIDKGAGYENPSEWNFAIQPTLTGLTVSDVTGDGCTVTVSTNSNQGKLYLSIRTAAQGGDYTEGDQALIRDGTVGVDCVYKDEVATPDYTVPQVFTVTGLDPGTTFHVGLAQDVDAV